MAEEPRNLNNFLSHSYRRQNTAKWFVLVLLCFFSVICYASQEFSPTSTASQSDLSVPLWGGGQAAMASTKQSVLSINEVKLHHFDELPCGSCHQVPEAASNEDWKSTVNVNQSCTSFGCHEYDEKMNHPLDVVIPAGASIAQNSSGSFSTVTCLSCHQPQDTEIFDELDGEPDYYLQDPAMVGCDSCHSKMPGTIKKQSHWKFSQKAHLNSLVPGAFNDKADDDIAISGIDSESNSCISCHDEVTVTIPGINESRQQKAERFRSMTDHPIGMDYQYVLSQNSMYFRSLMGMEKTIRMFDGKVGCGSCHSLYSDIPANLVVSNEDSAICHTCHNR